MWVDVVELGKEKKEVKGPRQFGHHNLIGYTFRVCLSANLAVEKRPFEQMMNQRLEVKMALDTIPAAGVINGDGLSNGDVWAVLISFYRNADMQLLQALL